MSAIELAKRQLEEEDYAVAEGVDDGELLLAFENDYILGFVLEFPDAATLIEGWESSSQRVLKRAQFALRRAEAKSWNTYLVLFATSPAEYKENVALAAIEEDLVGTRKIARAGMQSTEEVRAALLPLLAMQSLPRLDAVEMGAEIRLRTSELSPTLVDAFVSDAPLSTLSQLLEAER